MQCSTQGFGLPLTYGLKHGKPSLGGRWLGLGLGLGSIP